MDMMNKTPKEKYARIDIRVKPEVKRKIENLASKCDLTITEYLTKRAL